MTLEEYIRFVLRFLKENKIYYAYLYNARKDITAQQKNGINLDVSFDNYIESISQYLYKNRSMEYFFPNSFYWGSTREGHDFWEKISTKFFYEYQKETRVKKTKLNKQVNKIWK